MAAVAEMAVGDHNPDHYLRVTRGLTDAGTSRERQRCGAGPAGGPLDLDTRDLEILAVTAADGAAIDFDTDHSDDILGTRLRVQLPEGASSFHVKFRTSPEASALQWLDPALTDGGEHPYLFSQC